jgi:hypothetical protein
MGMALKSGFNRAISLEIAVVCGAIRYEIRGRTILLMRQSAFQSFTIVQIESVDWLLM